MEPGGLRRLAAVLRRMPRLFYLAYLVYRIFQPKFSVGVVGIVFNADGHVLLVEHVFHPRIPWGLPGGWIERNENPATAVGREIQEELELTVEVGQPVLAEVTDGRHLDMAYICYQKGKIGNMSRELLDYRWCDPHNLPPTQYFHGRAIKRALEMFMSSAKV